MKLTFDYYHNLEKVELRLCNPDGRELFPLPGKNRNLTLRFNDLSELTFEVDSKITLSDNTVVSLEAYDYIQTKRLVFVTNIGWFQITGVDEHDNGVVKYKTVTAESYQSVLKNKGFISEERVYCFYNPNDPYDDRYDSTNDESVPSVLGQWKKQLGIKQALGQGLTDPATPYEDWTVTYINSSLIYAGSGSKCRTFKENTTYGYDWMVNDVEEAFEVIVLFDFMYKTIHVMTPNEVAQKVNVIYTFNNFMKNVDINEASEDIVTVLNCNGDNCDITAVNPTGTNYICDFSYYMDKVNYRWMSSALITKLEQWKTACDAEKATYTNYVSQLRSLYLQKTQCTTSLQEMSLSLQDLKNAQNKRSVVGSGTPGGLCGVVAAENVQPGNTSIKSGTSYYSTAFTGDKTITAYQFSPSYNAETRKWEFSGASKTATANSIVADNLSDGNTSGISYWYFSDVSDGSSYCKLKSAVTVNKDSATSSYYCGGFDRYIAYAYPIIDESTGKTTYTDSLQTWINLREKLVNSLNSTNSSLENSINAISANLDAISSRLNILSYFANTPALLRELNCYWIEGDYTNDNIAVLEETTPEEEVDLSNELMDAGYIELSKVCQPRFSFSLESIDATKQYEFRDQMRLLELGKIITIEKEEGLWYYPALLEISMNLDNSEEFSMTFANAMRLDDWGYTYADLISDASSTSRKVSANWQDILAYAKEREEISSLIKDPLDTTLRASFANMVNQEFTVDKNGILGRKKVSETSGEFEKEQVRLINNLLIFTDDNWETAKTALGKIYYKDDDGNQVTSYGLVAETIIGSLIMGERLKIKNKESTVTIGAEGIIIKNENTGEDIFRATNNGELFVKNYTTSDETNSLVNTLRQEFTVADGQLSSTISKTYATQSALESAVTTLESKIDQTADSITLSVSKTYATQSALESVRGDLSLYVLEDELVSVLNASADVIKLNSNRLVINSTNFKLTADGTMTANKGQFTGSIVATNNINSDNKTLINENGIYFGNPFSTNSPSYIGDSVYSINNEGGEWAMSSIAIYDAPIITSRTDAYYQGLWYLKGWTIEPTKMQYRGSYNGHDSITMSSSGITSHFVKISRDDASGSDAYLQFWDSDDKNMRASMYMDWDDGYFMLYSWRHGIGIGAAGHDSKLWGTWYGSLASSSSRNLKADIGDLSDKHSILFDNLVPRAFRYKDGSSGRLHYGYIVDELKAAMDIAGLTSEECAAYCLRDKSNPDGDGGIRYDELSILTAHEVQKIKARIAELESIITQLTNKE